MEEEEDEYEAESSRRDPRAIDNTRNIPLKRPTIVTRAESPKKSSSSSSSSVASITSSDEEGNVPAPSAKIKEAQSARRRQYKVVDEASPSQVRNDDKEETKVEVRSVLEEPDIDALLDMTGIIMPAERSRAEEMLKKANGPVESTRKLKPTPIKDSKIQPAVRTTNVFEERTEEDDVADRRSRRQLLNSIILNNSKKKKSKSSDIAKN